MCIGVCLPRTETVVPVKGGNYLQLRELDEKSSLHIIIGQQLRLFQFKGVQWLKKTRTPSIQGLEADSDHISLA